MSSFAFTYNNPHLYFSIKDSYFACNPLLSENDLYIKPLHQTWQPCWLSRNYKTQFPCDACFPKLKVCFPQHNLATTVDKEKVLAAYTDVMSDQKADINW